MNNYNQICKKLIITSCICTAVILLCVVLAFILPQYGGAALTFAAVTGAFGVFMTARTLKFLADALNDNEKNISASDDYTQIKYDSSKDVAYLSENFSAVTGISAASTVISGTEYQKLVCELISCPSDVGADIYMGARPESWLKVRSSEGGRYEYTFITDVSDLAVCKNIIKTLKYYDSDTGLRCRDAFISKVREVSVKNTGTISLITILISGIDKLVSFKGTFAADRTIVKAAALIKRMENPRNIFAGRSSANEFCVLMTDVSAETCLEFSEKLLKGINDILSESDEADYVNVFCGYAMFEGADNDVITMLSSSDYAAYEAKTSQSSIPMKFNEEHYAISAFDFKKLQAFNYAIENNRINYHFQPIVDAHTGEIFGYEALMRPHEVDGIRLSPLEFLEIADNQGMLDRVELLTLKNTLSLLSENQDFFRTKKMFINSIPNRFIPDADYEALFEKYSGIFDKIIIEITEGCPMTPESLELMKRRYTDKHASIALDDYGSGYANESSLITIQPDYIKIDRSLIMGIDTDNRKKHLVSNMISFAEKHGIKALAEGVETFGELETVITLGVDLIQGYYTCKPNAVINLDIPAGIKKEILDINLKALGYNQKAYVIDTSEPVSIVKLALEGCTDITVKTSPVTLIGDYEVPVNMRINCGNGYEGTINIQDVNISGIDSPVLTLGRNCNVTLNVEKRNNFSYEGIRVPDSSSFKLTGNGTLNMDISGNNGVVIGGSFMQKFGAITLDFGGKLNITAKGDNIIAIGGSSGIDSSFVHILGGEINAALKGPSLIGIGAVTGNVEITAERSVIGISAAGQNVVGIGSVKGKANVELDSDVSIVCSGDNCCAVGALEGGGGKVVTKNGSFKLKLNAKNTVGIGSVNGKTEVSVNSGRYSISCEGNSAVGIGDAFGSENITITSGTFNIYTAASLEVPIGTRNGKTTIHSGNIVIDSSEDVNAFSPYGDPLEKRIIETDGEFCSSVVFGGSEYTYRAEPNEDEGIVTVYLPVGYEI
ncbi:MAG: EAL domain-containing protein [Oscillospiraceae bacterium]|nr:EAL domain-containing protein [Oscillospiraceae bacterium]